MGETGREKSGTETLDVVLISSEDEEEKENLV